MLSYDTLIIEEFSKVNIEFKEYINHDESKLNMNRIKLKEEAERLIYEMNFSKNDDNLIYRKGLRLIHIGKLLEDDNYSSYGHLFLTQMGFYIKQT